MPCKSIDQWRGWRDGAAQPAALYAAADQPLANRTGVRAMRWPKAATDTLGSRHAATTAVLNPAPCKRLLGDWDASEHFGVRLLQVDTIGTGASAQSKLGWQNAHCEPASCASRNQCRELSGARQKDVDRQVAAIGACRHRLDAGFPLATESAS